MLCFAYREKVLEMFHHGYDNYMVSCDTDSFINYPTPTPPIWNVHVHVHDNSTRILSYFHFQTITTANSDKLRPYCTTVCNMCIHDQDENP